MGRRTQSTLLMIAIAGLGAALSACSGGSSSAAASGGSAVGNGSSSSASIMGVATPSNVAVVTATNAQ